MTQAEPSRPNEQLAVTVDGRLVEATLDWPQASPTGPRRPRWMLRIDGGATRRGPLTWDAPRDPDTEREAIAAYVRERDRAARQYVATHGGLLEQLHEAGTLRVVADALGVGPEDLLPGKPGEPSPLH